VVTFNVGRANGYKGVVQFFNPKTKRMVIRRDFKVMNAEPVISSTYNVQILYEAVDDDVDDHPSFYGADIGPSEFIRPVVNVNLSEAIDSTASAAVEDFSGPKTDPFHSLDSGINASRDDTTGESVMFSQSELHDDLLIQSGLSVELPLNSPVDTQISNSSIPTDVMPVGVTFGTVSSVVEVTPGLSTEYEAVTIKRILSHTGLPQKSSRVG
jgi:hypothetical protein